MPALQCRVGGAKGGRMKARVWWVAFCIGFFAFLILCYRRVIEFVTATAAPGSSTRALFRRATPPARETLEVGAHAFLN